MWILTAIAIVVLVFVAHVRARRRKLLEATARLNAAIQAMRADYVSVVGELPLDSVAAQQASPQDAEQAAPSVGKRVDPHELPVAYACMSTSYVEQAAGLFAPHWNDGSR